MLKKLIIALFVASLAACGTTADSGNTEVAKTNKAKKAKGGNKDLCNERTGSRLKKKC